MCPFFKRAFFINFNIIEDKNKEIYELKDIIADYVKKGKILI
jgi:hypothetical protein